MVPFLHHQLVQQFLLVLKLVLLVQLEQQVLLPLPHQHDVLIIIQFRLNQDHHLNLLIKLQH